MVMVEKIKYSQKALNSLNSSEQDHLISAVKSPGHKFFLISLTFFLGALTIWSFYGRIADAVEGVGITLLSGGVVPVVAPGTGDLNNLNIVAGSKVQNNQIIGQINDSEVLLRVKKMQDDYDNLNTEIQTYRHLSRAKDASGVDVQTPLFFNDFFSFNNFQDSQNSDFLLQNSLLKKNYIVPEFKGISYDLALMYLDNKLLAKKRELHSLHHYYDEVNFVKSPFTGTVIEVLKERGAYVKKGDKLALIASDLKKGLYLVTFISATEGKRIKNGMRAFFSPSDAPSSRYGYIKAIVRDVSEVPINRDTILRELMNESLVDMLVGDKSAIRVVIELIPDKNSVSGYAWTGRDIYDRKITNGVYGKVLINTEYRAPISYVIPALREVLSGSSK